MKIRQIMDCVFHICTIEETIYDVLKKMKQHMVSYMVVVDQKTNTKELLPPFLF